MLANTSHDTLSQLHLLRKLERDDAEDNLLSFCHNDYLGLAKHPKVISAIKKGADLYGLGSGGSAQIAGYTKAHQAFEESMAAFLNRDKAILFNSGYHANLGVITALANRRTHIVFDKYCHASTVDGVLLSHADYHRFKHNNVLHADTLLTTNDLLITESVFSIHGDIGHAKTLAKIAQNKKATFIIDDAHGFGILGDTGRGISEYAQLNQNQLPCLITPLGKALGSMGAIVSGKDELIETLIQHARTHRYSTALPPVVAYASNIALSVLQAEPYRRKHLHELVQFFIMGAKERALPLISDQLTPIKSILTTNNKRTLRIQEKLKKRGIKVAAIRPPTAPRHQSCIRISLNYSHTMMDVTFLLDLLKDENDDNSK